MENSSTPESTRPQTSITKPPDEPQQSNNAKKKPILTPDQIAHFKEQSNIIVPLFSSYYKDQLNLSKSELDSLISYSTKDLPITFRISKINPYCDNLEAELSSLFLSSPSYNTRITRYKLNFLDNIFQIDTLNKKNPIDMKIREILIRENDIGILRQELVAMIPINLIKFDETDIILDMCAAPGNKTIQLLELMEEKARDKGIIARGVIIANEKDTKRAMNMNHFFKTQFPSNIIVTNCPAESLPLFEKSEYKPSIVLCDVPCSGDGTLRKNKGLRKRWKVEYGYQNHTLQIDILDNAVRQCRKGGHIIYSTCSINPIENEAVVCNVLERYKNEIELVNVVKEMNAFGIKFSEGLVKWRVCSKWDDCNKIEWVNEYSKVKKELHGLIKKTMFHNVYTKENYNSNIYLSDPLNLRRCIRIYSHQNNSGSFFIAVIKKKENIKENKRDYSVPLNKEKMKTIEEDLNEFIEFLGIGKDRKEEEKDKEELFQTQIDVNDNNNNNNSSNENTEIVFHKYVNIKEYKDSYDNLKQIFKFKNEEIIKYLYCLRETSAKVFLFSEKMTLMINAFSKMNLKIIAAGMTVFKRERQNFKTKYRLTHYGGIVLEPFLGAQLLELQNGELFNMLFNDKDGNIQLINIPSELKESVDKCEKGTIVLSYEGYVIVCRKGKGLLALMIPKKIFPSLKNYILNA